MYVYYGNFSKRYILSFANTFQQFRTRQENQSTILSFFPPMINRVTDIFFCYPPKTETLRKQCASDQGWLGLGKDSAGTLNTPMIIYNGINFIHIGEYLLCFHGLCPSSHLIRKNLLSTKLAIHRKPKIFFIFFILLNDCWK